MQRLREGRSPEVEGEVGEEEGPGGMMLRQELKIGGENPRRHLQVRGMVCEGAGEVEAAVIPAAEPRTQGAEGEEEGDIIRVEIKKQIQAGPVMAHLQHHQHP
jgi:hypothetical protein